MEAGVFPRFLVRMGLRNTFSSVVGSQQYLRKVYSLDAAAIARTVSAKLVRRSRTCMTLKRTFDLLVASAGLVLFSPLLVAVMLSIWLQDRKSPFYIAPRAARGGSEFRMLKFRSMVVNADKIGGSSTAAPTGVLHPLADSCARTNSMS